MVSYAKFTRVLLSSVQVLSNFTLLKTQGVRKPRMLNLKNILNFHIQTVLSTAAGIVFISNQVY